LRERLATDLAAAHREFTGAREQFVEITTAVEQARHTLEAEGERFRLGEGRSRNVLDAQNDLTKTYRTRDAIVAALLRDTPISCTPPGTIPTTAGRQVCPPLETTLMDIGRIKELLGLRDDKPEELEIAMEKQILPVIQPGKPDHGARQPRSPDGKRSRPLFDLTERPCAWCNKTCHSEQDGFHLIHVAFGATQERHCFCSDDCYEAFRRMYPSRVHRNCYETPCADCTFCIKRYIDESEASPRRNREPTR